MPQKLIDLGHAPLYPPRMSCHTNAICSAPYAGLRAK